MKTLNLVMAIIYTVILLLVAFTADDYETAIGCILLSGPVVTNWITYSNLNNKK
jgi:hypothetical protein